mmetsp:Transcript_1115/g.2406  ORF Transcript_1115/g.2406 Transcript_1115/m.2406 type:complete len:124 (+) Transcript_1115:752-1123(+)
MVGKVTGQFASCCFPALEMLPRLAESGEYLPQCRAARMGHVKKDERVTRCLVPPAADQISCCKVVRAVWKRTRGVGLIILTAVYCVGIVPKAQVGQWRLILMASRNDGIRTLFSNLVFKESRG